MGLEFDYTELSNEDGKPIRLYEFQRGEQQIYRYCSADRDIIKLGVAWKGLGTGVSDDGIRQSGEADQDAFVVTINSLAEVVALYKSYAPSDAVYLTVRDTHDNVDDAPVCWSGTIASVMRKETGTVQLSCQTLIASFDRNGVRLAYTRTCPYMLYDQATCKVAKERHRFDTTLQSKDGANFTLIGLANAAAAANKSFDGGFVEWADGQGNFELRGINGQNGDTVGIIGGTYGIEVGQAVAAYPGCPRTTVGCQTFNNLVRYGGAPALPSKSPFDGTPVF